MASSSGSEGVVHGGKLLVHVAENGHSFELDCDDCTLVEDIQRYLESVSGVLLNDQLLLCMEYGCEAGFTMPAFGVWTSI